MSTRNTLTLSSDAIRAKVRAKPGETARYLEQVVYPFNGDECLIWPYARNGAGYGHVGDGGRNRLVSRMACEHRHGPPPTPKHQAAHECGNGHLGCCNPRHLEWKTDKGNKADMQKHGTVSRGIGRWNHKLDESDVIAIRQANAGGESQGSIAKRYGVRQTNILAIVHRKTWKHVA